MWLVCVPARNRGNVFLRKKPRTNTNEREDFFMDFVFFVFFRG